MVRQPAQAGRFYPSNTKALKEEIEKYVKRNQVKRAKGVVSPHAGYIYSGKVAGAVYSRIEVPEKVVILGPNHTGIGYSTAITSEGSWQMPFGGVSIDKELAEKIKENSKVIKEDSSAHLYEHSIEVQLPFLQYIKSNFTFVPIVMRDYSKDTCLDIGNALAKAIGNDKVLIVASSDMTHYETQSIAEKNDKVAIREILNLDGNTLLNVVEQKDISMCGSGPVASMIFASKSLGANKAELVLYNTSGDITGDYEAVVGYAGIIVE